MPLQKSIDDLPDEILVKVFSMLRLEDIVLGVQYVSERWSEVSQDSKVWKNLSYKPCLGTPVTDIVNVVKRAPKLQIFCPFNFMKNNVLEAIITHCKDIRELELYLDHLNINLIERLVTECPNIENLSLVEVNFGENQCYSIISKCKKLRTLKLCGSCDSLVHTRNAFKGIADGCPALEALDLRNLYKFSNSDLQYLLQRKKDAVISLYISWSKEEGKSVLPVIECCSKLETLHIEEYIECEPSREFASLKKLHNLKSLYMPYLRHCNVNFMSDLFKTASLDNLIKLDLSLYECLENSVAWAIFEKCRKLRYLKFVYCPLLTDEGVEPIHNLTELEMLWLAGCSNITDEGILHVVKCSKLKYLNLNNCCSLTNKSFVNCCQNLPLLQELLLNSCPIDDQAALTVGGLLKNLKLLDVCTQELKENTTIALQKSLAHVNLSLNEGDDF